MDGSLARTGAEVGDGCYSVRAEAEQVADDAFVQHYSCRVYGAAVERLEFPVPKVAPSGLGLVKLPLSQLSYVKRN
jgi:hypothetical protein